MTERQHAFDAADRGQRFLRNAAIEIDDLFFPAKANLAVLYNTQGRNEEAMRLLREVLDAYPEQYESAYSLGLLLAAKLTLEWIGLSPAGLSGLPPGFEPALSAHVGGALGGLVAFAVTGPGSRPRIRQSRPGSTSEEQSWSPSASTRFPSRSESPS